jgi:hypothetical protein
MYLSQMIEQDETMAEIIDKVLKEDIMISIAERA